MKQIYVFGTRGFPHIQGGVEKHCEQLYTELAGHYEITVFRRIPFLRNREKENKSKIRFVDLSSTRIKGFEAFFHSFLCTLFCLIKRPDIVHVHNIGPGMFIPFLRLAGLKVVLTYHSANYKHKKWNCLERKILKLSEWIAIRGANTIIFVSRSQYDLFSPAVKRKAVVIPNGVRVRPPATSTRYIESLGLKPHEYILAVGRVTQEKGFDYLVEAYVRSQPHEFKLVIAGGVDHASAYADQLLLEARKHSVVMPGYVDEESLHQLYSHARLFILPSYHEGFSLALLEAISYNLPVLASEISPNLELGLNAYDFFLPGDTDDLSRLIKQKLSDPSPKPEYQLDHYTWPKISLRVANVYDGLI